MNQNSATQRLKGAQPPYAAIEGDRTLQAGQASDGAGEQLRLQPFVRELRKEVPLWHPLKRQRSQKS